MAEEKKGSMKTLDNEELIMDIYRSVPSRKIRYFGNYFRCLKIEKLTHSKLFKKSWIYSCAKKDIPPDMHNEKHKIMMEIMRVDDSSTECKNNSFKRANNVLRMFLGKNYKNENKNSVGLIIPDTRDNKNFNYEGYIDNLKRTISKHSDKINQYRKNYPKCESVIFFICDESNNYIEVANKNELKEQEIYNNFKIHYAYADKKFIDIIKQCNADFVIWLGLYKEIYVNGKNVVYPNAVIFDIKNLKYNGLDYNSELMLKVIKE